MKSLAVGLLLGAVSSTNLETDMDSNIWDESLEAPSLKVCGDTKTRWADSSNSWKTYVAAY